MSLTCAHLDGFLAAGLTAEQIVALVKTDIEERGRVSDQRRAKDAERQRRHRESRGVTRNNGESGESQRPPKESKSKPLGSEANASAQSAPDPAKQMFDEGVALLTSNGLTEERARNLLGKWRKEQGEAKVLAGILECRTKAVSSPHEYLTKRFKSSKWVSASGYEYRGTDDQVMREAERRNDMDTYWKVKGSLERQAA